MDLHSGMPYWLVRDGLRTDYPVLASDLRTDVVIVGGGITGSLCAYTFTVAGMDVVVLDGRSIGTGSTCASTSLLQYEIDTPLHRLIGMVGEKNAVRSYELCVKAIARLGAIAREIGFGEFTPRPSIQYASVRAHERMLATEFAARKAHGLPGELLDGVAEVRTALPFDAQAALRTTVAAETNAYGYTHALHAKSIADGARIFQLTEVSEFRDSASGVEVRTVDGHTVHAQYLVYATGYESRDLLPKKVIRLHSTYAVISEPNTGAEPWKDNALIWETAKPYLYMRTAPEGRIIIGGRDEPFRDPALRDALLVKKTKTLCSDFHDLMPAVPFRQEYAWCGTFGETKDGLPYIDRGPRANRSYYALGMGGNGITFSIIAAEIIRDRMMGRPNHDGPIFRFDR
ncbi:MAG: FAD-dependent oxidoreductase [Flavobacteriales bacterium]